MGEWYKKPIVYLGILLLLVLCAVSALFIPSSPTTAFLYVSDGDVHVDAGEGFSPAVDGMELQEGTIVKTGNNTRATIILYEKVIIALKADTEVSLEELTKKHQIVGQSKGITWSKVMRLSGVEEFAVRTPTTTATVRGTTLRTTQTSFYGLLVVEGTVTAGPEISVGKGEKLTFRNTSWAKENLTSEDLADIRQELEHEIEVLRALREREIFRNSVLVGLAKATFQVTDDQILEYFIAIDEGRASESDITSRTKIITVSMRRVFTFTTTIKDTLALLLEYS